MDFKGVIIEESLQDISVLKKVKIISTEVEKATDEHKTPWVKQWTLYTVEVSKERAAEIAGNISKALDPEHPWYADFKTEDEHYIIFRDRVFHITDRRRKEQYNEATQYGISLGIPAYQVDFAPHLKQWER